MTNERGLPPDEGEMPDDDSVENVREELARHERELAAAGAMPVDLEQDLINVLSGNWTETDKTSEEFAESLCEALGTVGLYQADNITAEKLSRADPEILQTLTPETAESLYFEVFRKSRKWLGNEPIKLSRLILQARAYHRSGTDLIKLQLLQRQQDQNMLFEMGIVPAQLMQITNSAKQSKQQNINRASFLFFDEPRLNGFTRAMRKRSQERGPLDFMRTVKMAKIVLRFQLEQIDRNKAEEANHSNPERRWDAITYDFHERVTHRIQSSIAIADLIMREMKLDSVDDLLNDVSGNQ